MIGSTLRKLMLVCLMGLPVAVELATPPAVYAQYLRPCRVFVYYRTGGREVFIVDNQYVAQQRVNYYRSRGHSATWQFAQ
jgi:hypothetical protein